MEGEDGGMGTRQSLLHRAETATHPGTRGQPEVSGG